MFTRLTLACLLGALVLGTAPVLGAAPAAAQSVPVLNVAPTCRDVPGGNVLQRDAAACMKSEDEARTTLQKGWSAFTPADQAICTQTATMGGTASYVELLTCLEMRRDARALPRDDLTRIPEPGKK